MFCAQCRAKRDPKQQMVRIKRAQCSACGRVADCYSHPDSKDVRVVRGQVYGG